MDILKEVFIKEVTEAGIDKVYVVKNLPWRFVYTKAPKQVIRVDRDGFTDGTMVNDPAGGTKDVLLDGIEYSQSGDGSIMFLMNRETGRMALKAIDRYISGTLPRDVVLPERVPYPLDPTNMQSSPRPMSMIPVVELPFTAALSPLSPPSDKTAGEAQPAAVLTPEEQAKADAKKQAARERMAHARAVMQAKKAEAEAKQPS